MTTLKVLGPPGTGKTTFLLNKIEELLDAGVRPVEIGFLTFTKKAATEAVERACKKFGFEPRDLPYFRTIHSLAYNMLGIKKGEMVDYRHLAELSKRVGVKLSGRLVMDDDDPMGALGDRMLFLENVARLRKETLRATWERDQSVDIQWHTLRRVADEYTSYKAAKSIVDFTDLLARYVAYPVKPRFKVLFIDEAQDLSALQWDLARQLMANAETTYVAGDDDQAIFQWAGADVRQFIELPADETIVLNQSYRIPAAVHSLANLVSKRIGKRLAKEFKPREEDGCLRYWNDLQQVDISKGQWLLLCRNRHQMKMLEEYCRQQRVPYDAPGPTPLKHEQLKAIRLWEKRRGGAELVKEDTDVIQKYVHPKAAGTLPWYQALTKIGSSDVAYYRGLRAKGESLFGEPRVRISTIHGAKGGEADNVLLLTDMAARNEEAMRRSPDEEHRVFYVGLTRAKQALHIIRPMTNIGYKL